MQGRSCDLFNCSPIYYYKYCGLIIQFNVKLTVPMMCHNILEKHSALYYARLILKGAIHTNQNIFSKNRVSLKSVADTETAYENHGAEGAFYYAIDGFVGDLIAKRKYLVGWKQF